MGGKLLLYQWPLVNNCTECIINKLCLKTWEPVMFRIPHKRATLEISKGMKAAKRKASPMPSTKFKELKAVVEQRMRDVLHEQKLPEAHCRVQREVEK